MVSRFDDIVDVLPTGGPAEAMEQWLDGVTTHPDPVEHTTGQVVLENLRGDEHYGDSAFETFVADLAKEHEARADVVAAYRATCKAHQKEGPTASIPADLSLHRLVDLERFKSQIAYSMGWDTADRDRNYERLMDPAKTPEHEREDVLRQSNLSHKPMVWGGFRRDLGDGDPIAGMDAARAKQIFGLTEEWYPAGRPVVRMRYCPPDTVSRRVPTVADADWNPYWMPAPAGTGHGLTRDLATGGSTPGRGEVVHDNGSLSWLQPPFIPDEVPE